MFTINIAAQNYSLVTEFYLHSRFNVKQVESVVIECKVFTVFASKFFIGYQNA